NYGPYQFPEKLIPLFISNLMRDEPVPVYGDGLNVRDWIHVRDHCAGIHRVWRDGRVGEVYNIGGRCERTNLQLTHALLEAGGKPGGCRPPWGRRWAGGRRSSSRSRPVRVTTAAMPLIAQRSSASWAGGRGCRSSRGCAIRWRGTAPTATGWRRSAPANISSITRSSTVRELSPVSRCSGGRGGG